MFQGSRSPMAATTAASTSVLNTSTDSNPDDDPNNSIIRKVRSRVSSIIPDALSKWFSPSAVKRPRETAETSSPPPPTVAVSGRNGNLLRQLNQQTEEEADREEEEEEEEDEDEAPPTRKKKRVEERFNTSLGDLNEDGSALPGPSGLNISAIDRRSSLPMGAQLPRGRNTFSSSTPSTSPQHQQQQSQPSFQRQQFQQRISYTNRTTVPYNFGTASSEDPIDEEVAAVDESGFSNSIRQRRGIREVSGRKRLNIPQSTVDRSISEPPAPIFGSRIFGRSAALPQQHQQHQSSNEDLNDERREEGEGGLLSNGNANESASESSSVSNLNLSQSDQNEGSRRLSGFMGNVSKRMKVGGSTGDLCFSSHLETEKSLFSAKNAGRAASGRPTFNASLYGSSSSLGSSNSSLFANSPFYNGRTMYGGASAYSARRDIRQKALRVPVQMRPASALSSFSSSNTSLASDTSALSNTAKRILEIMNQCSGPLSEARKLGSSLSLNSTLASAKVPGLVQARKRFNEEDLTINRSIRMSSPRTPYSRPQSSTPSSNKAPPTAELQIPSISQLLQMKRLQTNTESVRRLATESNATILNEPTEYKLPSAADSDDTNNNNKHTNKIRNKLSRVREEQDRGGSNNPVPQLVLPEVQLAGLKSVPMFDIKVAGSSAAATNGSNKNGAESAWKAASGKEDTQPKKMTVTGSTAITFKSNSSSNSSSTILPAVKDTSNSNAYKFSSPAKLNLPATSKPATLNSFKFSNPEPIGKSAATAAPTTKLTGFQFNPDTAKVKANVPAVASKDVSPAKAPLPLKSGSCLDALKSGAVPELKSGSCLDALKPAAPTASTGFGSSFKLSGSNKWECDTCMVRNDPDKSKCVSCETPKPGAKSVAAVVKPLTATAPADAGFKALVAQQSARWECADCMTRNDADKSSCVCCSSPKPGAKPAAAAAVASAVPAAIKSMFSMPAVTTAGAAAPPSDQGFKSLVAQQSAGKWECSACMTRNEATRSKCACCEQAKPGSTPSDAPSFSFGSKPASTTSSGFSFGVPKDADSASKDAPKSGFSFEVPASSSTTAPTSGGFTFGSKPVATAAAPSSEDKPKFSFGSSSSTTATTPSAATPSTGFSFGAKPAADTTDSSSKSSEKKEDLKPAPTFGSGGFSFGAAKSATESPQKKDTPSTGGFRFGSPSTATGASKPADSSPMTFGKPAATETSKATPTVGFGTLSSSPAASAFSFGAKPTASSVAPSTTTAPTSGMFSFGSPKPTVTVSAAESKDSATSSSATTTTAAPTSTTTTSVPIFGGAQKPAGPSITPGFSFSSTSTPATAPVAPSSTATPAAAPTPISSSTTAPAAAAAATTTVTVAPTFSFGAASKPTATEPPKPTSTGSTFVFGQNSQPATAAGAKVIPSFGSTATADKPSTFGSFGAAAAQTAPSTTSSIFGAAASSTATSAFSFTGASKPAEQQSSTPAFSFGAAAKPPTTQTNAAPVFGSPAATAKPMFGSPAAAQPSTGSTFGGFGATTTAGSNAAPAFGSSSFGAASNATGGQSIFGQSSAPAFGAAPSGFGGIASGSPFGGAAVTAPPSTDEPQPKKMFEFGASSAVNSSQPAVTPFQFGSGSNNNNNNNNNDGGNKPFSFSAHSTPSFNFTAGSNAGQTSAPFTFGGGQQHHHHQQAPPAGGMFTFGSGGAASAPGLGGMGEAAPVVAAAPAFQFGAAAAAAPGTIMPQQNPFAATSIPGQTQQRRKINARRRMTPR